MRHARPLTLLTATLLFPLQVTAGNDEAYSSSTPIDINGYAELRVGARTRDADNQDDLSIGEMRVQVELEKEVGPVVFSMISDFLYDPVEDRHQINWETGEGWLDIREASLAFSPFRWLDVQMGRQILTWGTGDLVFINDLFPKDFSYFSGRDAEYLKAPSDAIKLSMFGEHANLDLVYTPHFDADRFIDGRRLSFYNPMLGEITGQNAVIESDRPDRAFVDDEIALRVYGTTQGYEWAVYGYHGFWKSPGGFDATTGLAIFPRMMDVGASLRGVLGSGIAYAEYGYYISLDDRDGDDPYVNNSEMHLLLGYEQELITNLMIGTQYYLTHIRDYDGYRAGLGAGSPAADEYQHRFTIRLTQRMMNQNLTLSLFTFFSPQDKDAYFRPQINYKVDDQWTVELGANYFVGEEKHSYFGQFEDNSNVYFAARFGF